MDKVIYKNTENGVIYQVRRGKVFRWHEEKRALVYDATL